MESTLTPREIQARLRGGDSVADVAAAAGVDEDYIENFAGPVLAERENAAQLARGAQVRRRGEGSSQRKLADAVLDKLAGQGIDEEVVSWDAWRAPEENWTVAVSWPAAADDPAQELGESVDEDRHTALFEFDQRGRFSVAKDALARILIDDQHAAKVERIDPDAEPTIDLNDELAIVRAVQDSDPLRPAVVPDATGTYNRLPSDAPIGHIVNAASVEHSDWSEPDLEQIDGIYQIAKGGDMDVLYEMLAGFNEDSVRIYTGLTKPPSSPQEADPAVQPRKTQAEGTLDDDSPDVDQSRSAKVTTEAIVRTTVESPAPRADAQTDCEPSRDYWHDRVPDAAAPDALEAEIVRTSEEQSASSVDARPAQQARQLATEQYAPAAAEQHESDVASSHVRRVHAEPQLPEPTDEHRGHLVSETTSADETVDPEQALAPHVPAPAALGVAEPTQDSLLDDEPPAKAKPKSKARKRASVPSWDEIMFGSPQQRK